MRWNSTFSIINSLLQLRANVTNALKHTEHYYKCLKAHERTVLQELQNFLQLFAGMTELVSPCNTSLFLTPIVRAEIFDAGKANVKDCNEF
jgi:hypothetical protein